MPNPSILDQLTDYLTSKYPDKSRLWNRSDNNTLGANWLVATPTDVWGKKYADFKQPVPGNYPDFNLASCSPVTSPDSAGSVLCATVQSTVRQVKGTPANLSVGHSNYLYEALYETMVSARTLLDITTLTPPTGCFLAAFRNAITYLSTKPADQRPVVRILYSNPWPNLGSPSPWPRQNAKQFLQDIVRDVSIDAAMQIYVAVASFSWLSWNHSKIIAADGERALVGGHNMWGEHYLGENPVFDVSMQLSGQAALDAHDYADFLWSWVPWLAPELDAIGTPLRASYTFNASSGKNQSGTSEPPSYTQLRSKLQPSATGTASVISIGRKSELGWAKMIVPYALPYYAVVPSSEPADDALVKLIDLAQANIRLSLQSLQLFWWWSQLFHALASALQRGVTITIVLSNPGAAGGGLGSSEADYSGQAPAEVNSYMLRVLQAQGLTELQAKSVISERFKVASLRYSADETYPDKTPIPNHAKTLIVDDAVFYIGSQNLYPSDHNEFGYMVQDSAAAASYVSSYWTPLWAQAESTVSTEYSTEVQQIEQLEAMLFIMALRKNPRLNAAWTNAIAARQENAPSSSASADEQEAYKQSTAEILDGIIQNAGFYTRSTVVATTFKLPFFSDAQTVPNDDSDRFVQDIATNQALAVEFMQIINQPIATASQVDSALTSFLKSKGYNCTGGQVNASFDNLRNHALNFWIGFYRDGWVLEDGGAYSQAYWSPAKPSSAPPAGEAGARILTEGEDTPLVMPAQAPTVTIYGNTSVALDKDEILNPNFTSGVLSWQAGDGLTNATSGQLMFGEVTRATSADPFVGLECYGTITYPDNGTPPLRGTVSFYARRSAEAPPNLPPSLPADSTSNKANFLGMLCGVVGGVALVVAGGFYGIKNKEKLMDFLGLKKDPDYYKKMEPIGGGESTGVAKLQIEMKRMGNFNQSEYEKEKAEIEADEVAANERVREEIGETGTEAEDLLPKMVEY